MQLVYFHSKPYWDPTLLYATTLIMNTCGSAFAAMCVYLLLSLRVKQNEQLFIPIFTSFYETSLKNMKWKSRSGCIYRKLCNIQPLKFRFLYILLTAFPLCSKILSSLWFSVSSFWTAIITSLSFYSECSNRGFQTSAQHNHIKSQA